MRQIYILLFIILYNFSFAVSTRYINEFPFDKLSSYQLSNVSLTEQGGLELARSYQELYRSSALLWSLEFWQDRMLAGTGDTARILEIQGKQEKEVFHSEGDLIISDMAGAGDTLYVSTLPKSRILALGRDYKIKQEWSVTNKYIWDLIPVEDTLYILCGNPAALYSIDHGILSSLAEVSLEDNLLTGLWYQKTLYFSGERYLYRYQGGKVTAMAGFDNPITGLLQYQGAIYLVTATHDPSVSANPNSSGGSSGDQNSGSDNSKPFFGESALYKVSLQGNVEILYKKKNIQFVSLTLNGDNLLIGTGKDAGYMEYSLDGKRKVFSSLGQGKFMTTIQEKGETYGVLLSPTRIVRIDKTFSTSGTFYSDLIDTDNISRWGTPAINQELMPGTSVQFFTRTSLITDLSSWQPWKMMQDSILSQPGRYFQYKVILSSDGKNTPRVKGLSIPFLQENLAPRIDKVSLKYEKDGLQLSWNGQDDNKDKLNYDVFLALVEGPWVKLNLYPLSEESYTLDYKSYPQGIYRVKVLARDNWSNPDNSSLTNYQVSDSFAIDNQAPQLNSLEFKRQGDLVTFSFSAEDSLTPLGWAGYSLNGSPWKNLTSVDGILDQKKENFKFTLPIVGPGFLQILIKDSLGNDVSKGVAIP